MKQTKGDWNWIIEEARRKQLTISRLAAVLNVAPQTINYWVNGRRNPSWANTLKLAYVLCDDSANEMAHRAGIEWETTKQDLSAQAKALRVEHLALSESGFVGGASAHPPGDAPQILNFLREHSAFFDFGGASVTVRVHDGYGLSLDEDMRQAVDRMNRNRGIEGKLPYEELHTCYRLIRPPQVKQFRVELDVAPMNFAYLALLKEPGVPALARAHVRKRIQTVANRFPEHLKGKNSYLNERSYIPLGVSVVLISKDRKTLLRKRGSSLLTHRNKWGISFSGYSLREDLENNQLLDIHRTVRAELWEEIAKIPTRLANPKAAIITGLHINTKTGAIDILSYLNTDLAAYQIEEYLKVHAQEPFVWDSENLIADFSSADIASKLSERGSTINDLLPGAFVCLMRALELA